MRRSSLIALTIAAIVASGGAVAHHGWGSYDASKVTTVAGTVERVQWQNPHVHIVAQHQGGPWELVLAPPFRMDARGLNPDMIKAGTAFRVEGYTSTRVERELRAERIVVDGRTFELR